MCVLEVSFTKVLKTALSLPYYEPHLTTITIKCVANKCSLIANQHVLYCQQVPLDEVDYILCEDFFDDCLLVLHSKSQGSCVISLKKKSVLDHFEDTSQVFIDDYLNVGHDQVIFVFGTDDGEQFVVNDYLCCSHDTRRDHIGDSILTDSEAVNPLCEGFTFALSSLNKRILSLTRLLYNEKAKILEKRKIIDSTRRGLLFQSLNLETNPVNTSFSLVNIFGGNISSCLKDSDGQFDGHPFQICGLWKKITRGHRVVVGVDIENNSKQSLYDVSLCLASKKLSVSSTSNILFNRKIPSPQNLRKIAKLDEELGTPLGNSLRHKQRFNIMSCLTFPVNLCSELDFELLLSYSTLTNGESVKYTVFIGCVSISINDIMSDLLVISDKYAARDVFSNLAFNFLHHRSCFSPNGTNESLFQMPSLISTRLNCNSSTYPTTCVLKPKFLDAEMHFITSQYSHDCIVYGSSQNLVTRIITEIKKILPADVTIDLDIRVVCALFKEFLGLLQREIELSLDYHSMQLQRIEEEQERIQAMIIIDSSQSPKRKRTNGVETEGAFLNYLAAFATTDQFLISNDVF